jgi:hypothetical protein
MRRPRPNLFDINSRSGAIRTKLHDGEASTVAGQGQQAVCRGSGQGSSAPQLAAG